MAKFKNLGQKPKNEFFIQLMCETLADGSVVKFNRCTEKDGQTGIPVGAPKDYNLDGTAYTVIDEANVNVCPPPQIVEKTIGREQLTVGTAASGLGGIPAGADLAFITVNEGCGYVSDAGIPASDGTAGHAVAEGAIFEVCGEDIADFQAVASDDSNENLVIEVTYKQCVEKQ